MKNSQRCIFTEGSITLPDGYKEQTVNIIISPTGNALNISRDHKEKDETFNDYLIRQKKLLKSSLTDWQILEEKPSYLGQNIIDGALISSRYRPNKKQQVYQIQAVYPLSETNTLIFTMSSQQAFSDEQWTWINAILSSFQPNGS